jgi:hypothetical protein
MEMSGTVEYHNCREQVYIGSTSLLRLFKSFVCQKVSGAGEVCVSTNFEAGNCVRAYVYFK